MPIDDGVPIPETNVIFFYSSNAVRFFHQKYINEWSDSAIMACMGPGTARTLEQLGGRPDYIGNGAPEDVARALIKKYESKSILFPRAKESRKSVQTLIAQHLTVRDLVVYESIRKNDFEHPNADILIFTSPKNAEAYYDKYTDNGEIVMAIGPTTQQQLLELGLDEIRIPDAANMNALFNLAQEIILTEF